MNRFFEPKSLPHTLLAQLPIGILVYEADTGNCVLANRVVADMFGEKDETLRRENLQRLACRCGLGESALGGGSSGPHGVVRQMASGKVVALDCFISRFDFEGNPYLMCAFSDIGAHHRTREKLEQERALLRCVIDSASDLIFIKDQESVYRGCNKASEAFIGMPESEQIGKTDFDFFDPAKAEEIREADRQVMTGGKPMHYEEWVTDPDGRRLLMDTVKSPYYDPHGKPLGLVGIGRDLTERKLLEQERLAHSGYLESMDRVNRAIQAADNLRQMMRDVLDVVLAVLDGDRAFLLYPCDPKAGNWKILMERTRPEYPVTPLAGRDMPMTPPMAETFGVLRVSDGPVMLGPEADCPLPPDLSEPFGARSLLSMALHPRAGPAWLLGLQPCAHGRGWTKEEERLFQEIGRRMVDGLSTMLALRDMRRSMRRLAEAQRLARIGNWELDLTDNVLTWSDEIFHIFEIDSAKFGASYEAFLNAVHPDDRESVNQAYTSSLESRTPYAIEHRLLFSDGRIKHVHEQCRTYYADDKPIRSIGTVQDITERKKAEEALQQLNAELDQRVMERTAELEAANKEMHEFTYTVSHDLRAPLRHIDGFTELVKRNAGPALEDRVRNHLDAITDAAKKMGMLIDDLLAFTRMRHQTISPQTVDLEKLVHAVIEELEGDAAGRKIDWRIYHLPEVTGDAAMLRRVLNNLIANAIKFTRPRGMARIEIGSQPGRNADIVIFVRDNGVGFDMAYVNKLFGVFQRLHRDDEFEGTGIGLANVRRIIARHGGRTWAEGKPGKGATFYFSLPLHEQKVRDLDPVAAH